MAGNEYLLQIVRNKTSNVSEDVICKNISTLISDIKKWANGCLEDIYISGSRAKGTAIKGSSDIDLLISLKSTTNNTLSQIYNSLFNNLNNKYTIRTQNVSLGINYNNYKIDLVPAKKQSGHTNDHSLYCSKQDTWMQTNIQENINYVANSGRLNEIKLIKIWTLIHKLDFPSMYIEYVVIEALKNKRTDSNYLADNVWTVFKYLSNSFLNTRFIDIANSNNIISEMLNTSEKNLIVAKAKIALAQTDWKNIIW